MKFLAKSNPKMQVVVQKPNESGHLVAKDEAIRDSALRNMTFLGLFLISITGVFISTTQKPTPYLQVAFQLGIYSVTWICSARPMADIHTVLVSTTSAVVLSALFFAMSLPAWFGYTNLAIYNISQPVSYAMCMGVTWLNAGRMCWLASGERSERIWRFFSTFFSLPSVDLDHLGSESMLAFGVSIGIYTIDTLLLAQLEMSPESEFLVIVIPEFIRGITKHLIDLSISFAASTLFLMPLCSYITWDQIASSNLKSFLSRTPKICMIFGSVLLFLAGLVIVFGGFVRVLGYA